MKIEKNIWDKYNYIINGTVSSSSFLYLQKEFFYKYRDYITKLPVLPKSEEEASYANFKLSDSFEELLFYKSLLKILACTSIETYINTAGINCFSEKFYKKTVERNNIIDKIKLLVLFITEIELEDSNINLKLVREMFDKRNSLVHPKAKKITSDTDYNLYSSNKWDINIDDIKKLLDDFDIILLFLLETGILSDFHYESYSSKKINFKWDML